jgi:hypothetical protein
MRAAFLLAFLIAAASADFSFQGNVTVKNTNDFNYRDVNIQMINFPGIQGVFEESISTVNNTNQKDVVTLAFFSLNFGVPQENVPPTALVSFFTSYSNYLNVKAAAAAIYSINLQTSDTVVSKTFLSLEEVNTTNNFTVRTINLVDLTWNLVQSTVVTPAPFLNYVTLKGTSANVAANFSITITALFSQVLGLLNVVGAPVVTPKSLETTVNILNYPYQSRSNALRLNLVIGTGQSNFSLQGSLTITSGNGTNANYVYVSNQVVADGNVQSATLSVSSQQTTGSMQIDNELVARYQGQQTFTKVSIQFPAGANNITFDPTAGAGTPPQVLGVVTGASGASTSTTGKSASEQVGPIFALLFLLVALLF